MNQEEKNNFYIQASTHVKQVISSITCGLKKREEDNDIIEEHLVKGTQDNKIVQQRLLEHGVQRVRELEALIPSPYFVRCLVQFDTEEQEELFFGKFSFTDEYIYSWVTPVSSLRFEKPGKVSYVRPDGEKRRGVLLQKDQYMITDGTIVFLATESVTQERALVYQAYFSTQKKGFVLPEIVSQMEKAQDTVIRANHRGPLLISGPAGSGKTTLALHRVAYLVQSPDVSDIFRPTSIIVFVQDEGTRDYFDHLLPELGIKGVHITTFATWAMHVLNLTGYTYVFRFGENEQEKDIYEYAKRDALRNIGKVSLQFDVYQTLGNIYDRFSDQEKILFQKQMQEKKLDRFDLTILLLLFKKEHGELSIMQEYYKMAANGSAKKKIGRFPVTYSLMIFDEFQNYLPEQIVLAKSTLDPTYNAVMYVGDMVQQTQLGTLQDWNDAREHIADDRKVVLKKVYRNTKNIVEYIQSLGYNVTVDEWLKQGDPVVEHIISSKEAEIAYVQSIVATYTGSIGVLCKDKEYLHDIDVALGTDARVHVMTIHEAQGVEFDTVCIVGISKNMFVVEYDETHAGLAKEKKRINRDLLYVALTRAMSRLYVLGTCPLKEILAV